MTIALNKESSFQIHHTASNTCRVLVDGAVHPLLVGFHNPTQAFERMSELGLNQVPVKMRMEDAQVVKLVGKNGWLELKEAEVDMNAPVGDPDAVLVTILTQ